jgi:hypothetical protein
MKQPAALDSAAPGAFAPVTAGRLSAPFAKVAPFHVTR